MRWANDFHVYLAAPPGNASHAPKKIHAGIVPLSQPVLTICNHRSVADDPVLLTAVSSFKFCISVQLWRHGYCAKDVCFRWKSVNQKNRENEKNQKNQKNLKNSKNEKNQKESNNEMQLETEKWSIGQIMNRTIWMNWFHSILFGEWTLNDLFYAAKVVPIERGKGLFQDAINYGEEVLKKKGWLHLFPEGRVVQKNGIAPFKWGVGKLIESNDDLVVVPMVAIGLDQVFDDSRGKINRYFPVFGKKIRVLIGSPISFAHLIKRFDGLCESNSGWSDPWPPHREELYASIATHMELIMKDYYDKLQLVSLAEDAFRSKEKDLSPPSILNGNHYQALWTHVLDMHKNASVFDGESILNSLPAAFTFPSDEFDSSV